MGMKLTNKEEITANEILNRVKNIPETINSSADYSSYSEKNDKMIEAWYNIDMLGSVLTAKIKTQDLSIPDNVHIFPNAYFSASTLDEVFIPGLSQTDIIPEPGKSTKLLLPHLVSGDKHFTSVEVDLLNDGFGGIHMNVSYRDPLRAGNMELDNNSYEALKECLSKEIHTSYQNKFQSSPRIHPKNDSRYYAEPQQYDSALCGPLWVDNAVKLIQGDPELYKKKYDTEEKRMGLRIGQLDALETFCGLAHSFPQYSQTSNLQDFPQENQSFSNHSYEQPIQANYTTKKVDLDYSLECALSAEAWGDGKYGIVFSSNEEAQDIKHALQQLNINSHFLPEVKGGSPSLMLPESEYEKVQLVANRAKCKFFKESTQEIRSEIKHDIDFDNIASVVSNAKPHGGGEYQMSFAAEKDAKVFQNQLQQLGIKSVFEPAKAGWDSAIVLTESEHEQVQSLLKEKYLEEFPGFSQK